MISDIKVLKELILFAKSNKIKHLKVDNVEFSISDLAFVNEIYQTDSPELKEMPQDSKTLTDTIKPQDEEDLLFWSSKT